MGINSKFEWVVVEVEFCRHPPTQSQLRSECEHVRDVSDSNPLRDEYGLENAGNMQALEQTVWNVALEILSNKEAAKKIDEWARTEHGANEARIKKAYEKQKKRRYKRKPFNRSALPLGNFLMSSSLGAPLK